MLIRRFNLPFFVAIALLGPLAGGIAGYLLSSASETVQQKQRVVHSPPTIEAESPVSETSEKEDEVFTLPSGETVQLDEIAPGRKVAIIVMKGTWCPVCQKQLKRLARHQDELTEAGATVVGLTHEIHDKNRRLLEKLDIPFTILSDSDHDFLAEKDFWMSSRCHAVPGMIYLDKQGNIIDTYHGRYPNQPQEEVILNELGL